MKKRKILYLFPLIGLLLSSCDAEEILAQIGNGFNNGKDWVVNTVTGKTDEKEEEHEEEKPQEHQGEEEKPPVVVKDFEGITLEDLTVPYDGKAHTLEVQGALPAEAKVTYGEHGNSFTNVGRYEVTAVVSAEGYNDLNLQATLTITKGKLEGITLEDLTIVYDGQPHSIEVQGDLPEGATVSYGAAGNEFKYPGAHKVKATISCPGYEDLVLTATLTIVDAIFEGVVFEDAAFTYDGKAHRIEVGGELPAGATVSYPKGNSAVDPGEYEIEAIVKLHGYQDLELTATLTILEAEFEGIVFEDKEVYFNGAEQEIAPVVPEMYKGATITYGEAGNKFTDVGSYEVEATVSLHGYVSWTGKATLTIATGTISGVSLEDATVQFDGEAHTIALTGELPAGVTFEYKEGYESAVHPGSYEIKGVAKGEGYFDLDLSATLTIEAKDATEPLMVTDFEGLTDNDLADDYELKYFQPSGWVDPSAAKMTIEKGNQVFGSGNQTMKLSLTHQNYDFKVTKAIDRTYEKYTGFAIDTMMDSRAEGGVMGVKVQFWFKDLPLPEEYAGYRNTYVTYTLSNDAPSTWTHWEIPFTDESMSICSGKIPAAALAQLGFTIADLSIYIDQVAVIISQNYVNGANCYAYLDNIELTRGTEKNVEQHIYSGRYATVVGENYFAVDINEAFNEATFSQDGQAIAVATVEKAGQKVTFKDKDYAGAGLTIETAIENDGSLTVSSVTGQAAASFAGLNGLNFVKHANVNLDFAKETIQTTYVNANWKQEMYGEAWTSTSGQMRVRGTAEDPHVNCYAGYKMTYRYTYTNKAEFGLANKFNIDIANYFNGAADILLKIKLVNSRGQDKFIVGDSSNFATVPAGTPKWYNINVNFDEDVISSVVIVVKGTASQDQFFYFDNLRVEYAMPEPVVPVNEISDGVYYIWNAANDAYRLEISDNLSKASVTKYGSENAYPMSVSVNGNDVTIKDTTADGAGLTIVGNISANDELLITAVTGAMASAFSASLVNKTAKKCEDVDLDFSDGTKDQTYTNSHWTEQHYGNNGWTDYAVPTQMRSKVDKNNNKVVNFAASTTAYNFLYTPDTKIGPVNHLDVDLGNYYSSSPDQIRYKISLLASDGKTVAKYVAGDGSNWATIAKDTSQGNLCQTYSFDFDLTFAYFVRITVSTASGSGYLYMDNLKVNYKAPEPVTPPQPAMTIEDGLYYIWNGSDNAFKMSISDSQTKGTVAVLGGNSYEMSVAINGETVTFKDAGYAGAGLTIVATITAENEMKVTEVTGAMASAFSASLLNKTIYHCADVDLDFSDGTKDQTYTNSHWTEQHYGNNGWTDYATPTQMRSKVDKNNNKVVNFAASTTAYNFLYTPDVRLGPVNHLEVDLGNYYSSSPDQIRYKIALLASDGKTVSRYVAGDANNWATIAKDTSQGNLCKTLTFDFNVAVAYYVRITVSTASGSGYLYMDNLKVSYKEPVKDVQYKLVDKTSTFDIAVDGAEFYAWVWDASKAGYWITLELKTGDDGHYFDVTLPETIVGIKIARVNPSANNKPVEGATEYGTYSQDEVWNETGDIALNGQAGSVEFNF